MYTNRPKRDIIKKKMDKYTYRITWSGEDGEYVGLCAEFPGLSWLAATPEAAFSGIYNAVREAVEDMRTAGEAVPEPLSEGGLP